MVGSFHMLLGQLHTGALTGAMTFVALMKNDEAGIRVSKPF